MRDMSRPRLLIAALLGLAAMALSACGFTPLYAQPGVSPGLASIETIAPDGRLGYLVRESLDDELAYSPGKPAAYRLELKLIEHRTPRGLRVDNVASRYEYTVDAQYRLVSASSGELVRQGAVKAEVTYDEAGQPYAGIATQQDAQARVAAEVARKVRLDLSIWLAHRR
jgi:LPS-assembly lipoprotein